MSKSRSWRQTSLSLYAPMVSVLEGHEYDLFTARAASCPRQFSGLFNIDLEHILLETLNDYNTLRQVVNLT